MRITCHAYIHKQGEFIIRTKNFFLVNMEKSLAAEKRRVWMKGNSIEPQLIFKINLPIKIAYHTIFSYEKIVIKALFHNG